MAVAIAEALFCRKLKTRITAVGDDPGRVACNGMDDPVLLGVQAFVEQRVPAWR